jgi:hypothetical protein
MPYRRAEPTLVLWRASRQRAGRPARRGAHTRGLQRVALPGTALALALTPAGIDVRGHRHALELDRRERRSGLPGPSPRRIRRFRLHSQSGLLWPGGLREKVLAHLDAYPDGEFTPHEIHKVLNHSSGAIANALDTLVKLGEAELATDKPRRFRRAAKAADAAPEADGAGSAQDDGAELAGAA